MCPYDELIKLVRSAGVLVSVDDQLNWDQQVLMPKGELPIREQQAMVVQACAHKLGIDPRIGELLAKIDRRTLTAEQAANVREIEFSYTRAMRVPPSLIEEHAKLTVQGQEVWADSRANNDFAKALPILEQVIEIKREIAQCIDSEKDPYDVLVQDYEPGSSAEEARRFFREIEETVVPLVAEISRLPALDTCILEVKFPEQIQMDYLHKLLKTIGYDFTKGRLDTTPHPMTMGYGRITTRFSEGWGEAILSTMHEKGHGQYCHNLPIEHFGTPLGTHRSAGVHESQARFWENHIGKSWGFWVGQYSALQSAYGLPIDDVDHFYRLINVVKPGFIRTRADECTYPLHIALRVELEIALLSGDLVARDLPWVWKDGMKKRLGIVPSTDTDGCLQDILWWGGALGGYFQTYVVPGSILSAQLWVAVNRAIPDLLDQIIRGDFAELNAWFYKNIHRHGCRYPTKELILRATGEELTTKPYTEYLNTKFRGIYDLN